jgi:Domain of unknown function (DUF4037)
MTGQWPLSTNRRGAGSPTLGRPQVSPNTFFLTSAAGGSKNIMMQQSPRLPSQATQASHVRYHLAQTLAENCPLKLGQEIIISGSVSKGLADQYSDIEQVFYVQELPDIHERDTWLRQLGATDIIHDDAPIADGSVWSTFRFKDCWIEAGWQTIQAHEELLHQILTGQVLDHARLILADMTVHAISLRSQGLLTQWQEELAAYPPALAHILISEATEYWRFPHLLTARRATIHRNDPLKLTEFLVSDLHRLLRILFAFNQRWEPEWKWIGDITNSLEVKPEHLIESITRIFSEKSPAERLSVCFQLIYDTLILLPPQYDINQTLNAVRTSLGVSR